MIVHNAARRAGLVPFAVCASLLAALPVRGQDSPPQRLEIKAVVRISKDLIEDVAGRQEIVATIPLNAIVLGFRCEGVIDGRGKLSVNTTTAQGDATFVINARGTAQTYTRGVRGPIVAAGPAWGPFASQTVVRFDGRKFTSAGTTPWAEVHGELECLEGRHGTRAGRAVGRLLLPVGRRLIPRAEAEATPIGEYYLTTFVDNLAEKIVTKLNQTTPVEQSLHRLFPETKDWGFQMSADAQFIQAAYGPEGSAVPVLPENPGRLKDVRLELWVQSTNKEAEALAKLSRQPLAKPLINKYLETILPELAALAEERSVDSVGSWLVISIGAPKAE
jgi:hypothetical protein